MIWDSFIWLVGEKVKVVNVGSKGGVRDCLVLVLILILVKLELLDD